VEFFGEAETFFVVRAMGVCREFLLFGIQILGVVDHGVV
jgi:hypothetical protein